MHQSLKKNLNKFVNFLLFIFLFHTILFSYVILKNYENTSFNFLSVLIILTLIIFYIYLIITKKELKFDLIITIIIIYSSIYLFEHYLDVTGTVFKSKKELDQNYDIREKEQVIIDLAKQNKYIFPQTFFFDFEEIIDPNEETIHPLSGISYSNTISCNELGFWPIIKRDKYGFSNQLDYYDQALDYLILGDSLAEGWCVNQDDNLQSLLNKNNKRTISLGVAGTGPLFQLAVFQEYLEVVQSKKIILLYYEGNDLKNLSRELQNSTLINYLNNENYKQGLVHQQKKIDEFIKLFFKKYYVYSVNDPKNDLTYNNQFYRIAKLSNLRLLLNLVSSSDIKIKNDPDNIRLISIYGKLLDRYIKLSQKINSQLYFVYMPDWTRIKQSKLGDNELNFKNEIISLVENKKISVLDLTENFSKTDDPLNFFPFRKHGHLNQEGYKFIYQSIIDHTNNQH